MRGPKSGRQGEQGVAVGGKSCDVIRGRIQHSRVQVIQHILATLKMDIGEWYDNALEIKFNENIINSLAQEEMISSHEKCHQQCK